MSGLSWRFDGPCVSDAFSSSSFSVVGLGKKDEVPGEDRDSNSKGRVEKLRCSSRGVSRSLGRFLDFRTMIS